MPSTLTYCALDLAFIFCLSIEKTISLDDSGRTEITALVLQSTFSHTASLSLVAKAVALDMETGPQEKRDGVDYTQHTFTWADS